MNNGLSDLWSALGSAFDALGGQEPFAVGALFLALVFSVSGIPKLRRPDLAALAISDFGVTERARLRDGLLLGAAELLLACALAAAAVFDGPLRAVPAIAATLLLGTFSLLIWRSLRSEESFACYCFGDAEETISWLTLLRTMALAALAGFLAAAALAAGGGSETASLATLVLEAVVASASLSVLALLARVQIILEVPHVCD